jgi:DNA-binding beta-propeller fold protein YncE
MSAVRIAWIAAAGAALVLAACNNGNSHNESSPHIISKIAIPNIGSTSNFSFDLGTVDSARGLYYFTDRNNKSVDVIDIRTNTLVRQVTGFSGCNTGPTCAGANNDKSGPNGVDVIPNTNFIFVGDVNAVRVIDTNSWTVVKTINVGGQSGLRADEGCYDADHNVYMVSSPGENPPFATFIDVTTQKVIATLLFTDPGTGPSGPASAGLEACVYDHATASFMVNNDGSTANPRGELDVIPASAILTGTPASPVVLTIPAITPGSGWKIFPEGNCDPTGLALGPGTEVAVSCRQGNAGEALTIEFLDRVTGALIATVNAGGSDQIAYDPGSNRYFIAASRWTSNGLSSGGSCGSSQPCMPTLFIIDASSHQVVSSLTTGNNAHSVAYDPSGRQVYLPYSSAAAPGGCLNCQINPEGGVLVYQLPN